MSDIDFKVDNYSIEDLLEIFGIREALPQNEIIERGSGLIEKYRQQNKSNYVNFFSKATNKLLSNYRMIERFLGNPSDSEDEQEGFVGSRSSDSPNLKTKYVVNLGKKEPHMLPAENMWQHNQYQTGTTHQQLSDYTMPRRTDSTHVPTNLNHSVQLRKKLMLPNAYSQVPFSQGSMNPTLQNTYLTWVNVDSQFRDITSTTRQSTSCDIHVANAPPPGSIQRGSATDFIFTLNEPINNVLSMSLGSLELPLKGYYVFSKSKGNTTFDVKFTWGDIGYLENNKAITDRIDAYIVASSNQIVAPSVIHGADPLYLCSPSTASPNDCGCDGLNLDLPDGSKVHIPPYTGPFCGYPEEDEQLTEMFGNFGAFTSYSNIKDLHVPKSAGQFHCAQIPQGNYQNSTVTSAVPIEQYLTLAMQGIVGPQTLPQNPFISNIWTPPSDTSSNMTFIKAFISKGSGKPFFSLNGSFDWWINGTLPLCVPTATFLHAPGIGMSPPGFGAGWWNVLVVAGGGAQSVWLGGTPVPCNPAERHTALTPREIWGRVGRQYASFEGDLPPSNLGFNLLDLDIFGRFIYYWNEIVCNWAHTNIYDLFILGPTRWKKFRTGNEHAPPKPGDEAGATPTITGGNNSFMPRREPWTFAEGMPWEAKNYIDQLPLTFEQFLKMQPGYKTLRIASKSGGVGFWNVSKQDNSGNGFPEIRPAPPTGDPGDLTSIAITWPFIHERPIDPSGWQNGLDTRTKEGYWHNKDNFDPQDHAWEQLCTKNGGWFGIGGEIPYPATTYVRGCPDISMNDPSSCVQKCKGVMGPSGSILQGGGVRDDTHFPYPYGAALVASSENKDAAGWVAPWCCSTAGSSSRPAGRFNISPSGETVHMVGADVSGTLSEAFTHCQGATWQGDCSGVTTDATSTTCSRPHGTTGGIWCAQSAVGSGLYGSPQTDISGVKAHPRSQWSNGLIPPFALNQVQTYVLYYIDKVLIPMAAENRKQIWNANHYPAKMPVNLLVLMIKTTRQWLWLGGVRQQAFMETTRKYPFPLVLPWPFPFCQGFPNYIHPPTNWIGNAAPSGGADVRAAVSLTRPFAITSPGFLPHLPRFDLQWYNPCDPFGGLCSPPTCENAGKGVASQNKVNSGRKQNGNLGWNLGFTDFISKSAVHSFEGEFANGTYPEGFVENSILQTGEWIKTNDAPTPPLKFKFDLSGAGTFAWSGGGDVNGTTDASYDFDLSGVSGEPFPPVMEGGGDISGTFGFTLPPTDGSGSFHFDGGTITQVFDSPHCATNPSCNFPPNSTWVPYADISGQEWTIKGAPPWIYLQLIYCMTQKEKEEFTSERITNAKLYGETALQLDKTTIMGQQFPLLAPGQGPDNIITNAINPSPWAWNFWAGCQALNEAGPNQHCLLHGTPLIACSVCGPPPLGTTPLPYVPPNFPLHPAHSTGWPAWGYDVSACASNQWNTDTLDLSGYCCAPGAVVVPDERPTTFEHSAFHLNDDLFVAPAASCQASKEVIPWGKGKAGWCTLEVSGGHVGVQEYDLASCRAWQLLGVCPRYCTESGIFESGGPPWPWAWPADLPSPYTFGLQLPQPDQGVALPAWCKPAGGVLNPNRPYWSTHNDDGLGHAFLKPWSPEWIERCYIPGWTYYKLCPTTNSTWGTVCMTKTIQWACDISCNDSSGCPPPCTDANGTPITFPLKVPAQYSNYKSQLVPLDAPTVGILTNQMNSQTSSSNCNALWMGINSDCIANLNGTNYITLIIDEFNKNRFVGNMPGLPLPSSLQQFKAPSYAQRVKSSFPVCTVPPMCCPSGNALEQELELTRPRIAIQKNRQSGTQGTKRRCRKGTQNPNDIIDGSNNITQAQKFTALQIANHQAQKQINQYFAPALSNVLIRLPLERWQMSQGGQLVLMPPYNTSSGGRGMGRRYYGPVTIKRLHVKIVDDLGFPLDLTCGNVSFSLLLERLYQY